MKKKVLFVADWPESSGNVEELQALLDKDHSENHEWKVWSCKKRVNNSIPYRWYCYLKGAIYIIANRKNYDAFFIWQQMVGFILFEILNVIRFNIPDIVFYTFFYHPVSFFRYFKWHMIRNALKHARGVIWISTEMAAEAKVDFPEYRHKVYSTLNPIMDVVDASLPVDKSLDEPYFRDGVYAAGKSGRDFDVVIRAFRDTDIPVTIVCPDDYPIREKNISSNIRILGFSEVSHEQYYALAGQSFCILISVADKKSPCGQLMVNFAMENSKPVIATDSYGARDYITNGVNGVLFKLGDEDEIRNSYAKLRNDAAFRNKVIRNANKTAEKMHPGYLIEKIIGILESGRHARQKTGVKEETM